MKKTKALAPHWGPIPRVLALFQGLSPALREVVDADIALRLTALRDIGIPGGDLDQMYVEAIEIAQLDARHPPPPPERYEARRSYQVYQSPKGA